MTEQDATRGLLQQQRLRMVAGIMGHAERNLYGRMTPEEKKAFRSKVLSSIDTYHDFVLDLLKVYETQRPDVNEEAIRLIREMHERMVEKVAT